jgi:hypothetical protein
LNIAVVSAAVATAAFMLTLTAGRDRAILGTTLVVGLGGLATTFVGGDLLHNVLVVDAQTWRAIWLLAVVANAFAVRHLVRTLTQHPIRPPELLLLSGLGILLLGRVASIVYFPADAALLAGFVINLPGLGCHGRRGPRRNGHLSHDGRRVRCRCRPATHSRHAAG